jgi:two-component system cell cycle response regulator
MKSLSALNISGHLPSPKGVALAILELCQRDDATLADIAKVVQSDPALSGRLLRQANLASNGGRSIASVATAVSHLGLGVVRQLALSFSLVDQYQQGACIGFDYKRFWSRSLLMGLAMKKFGELGRGGPAADLFCCGLMASIGTLGLATAYPAEYAKVLKLALFPGDMIAEEQQRLQTDHRELSAALLMDWGIPKVFAEAVFWHESPATSGFSEGSRPDELTRLLFLAKSVADLCLAPEAERNGRTGDLMRLGGGIGFDAEDVGRLVDELVRQWQEWGELLMLPAEAVPAFSEMAVAPRADDGTTPSALRVLIVDDDPTALILMETLLGVTLGHKVYCAANGQQALAVALEVMPQIVVTDWMMPVMDGLEFCRTLRAAEWGQNMYVIMLTGIEAEDEISKAFEAGVDDYVAKPINSRALSARMRAAWHYVKLLESWERDRAQLKQFAAELAISNRRLERISMTDLLTDLPNRRAGMSAMDRAWKASDRSGQPLAVLMIDVDHFKAVNDEHGHAVGDAALKEVAKAIQNSARTEESVCRLGGEEFLVICGNVGMPQAILAAERLRMAIKAMPIRLGALVLHVTVSVGVALKEPGMADADALLNAADLALYGAKNAGRDRTRVLINGTPQANPRLQ